MCRSIKTLRRDEPPVGDEEVRAAALQFIRKVSGYRQPSKANASAFGGAVDDVAQIVAGLLQALGPGHPGRAAAAAVREDRRPGIPVRTATPG